MAHDFGGAPKQPPSGGGGALTPGKIQPRIPTGTAATREYVPHAPTPMFLYKCHPKRWQMIDGEWLPLLGKLKLDNGCNGVDKSGNIDHAVIAAQRRGWALIPWDVIPDTYVRAWPTRLAGQDYNCSKWETPRWIGDQVLDPDVDTEGYNDFLRLLVSSKAVPPPDPAILTQLHHDRQQKRIQNLVKDSHKPGIQPILESAQARLEEMQAATADLRGTIPAQAPPSDRKGELLATPYRALSALAKQITGQGGGKKAMIVDRILAHEAGA